MFTDYQVSSNQESGLGRYNIAVLPTFKKKRGLLFELKVSKTEEETQKILEKACQQILDKNISKDYKEKDIVISQDTVLLSIKSPAGLRPSKMHISKKKIRQ